MTMRESLQKILQSEELFGTEFYRVFFRDCPKAAVYFEEIDMKRQALVLTMALTLVEQYHSGGYAAVEKYLQHIGTKHNDRGIPRDLYADWRDAMLVTLQGALGDDWDDALASEWRVAIDAVTEAMFRGYDHRVGI